MRPRVVHVVQSLSRGGAGRSLLATAAGSDVDSTLVSLTPADPRMLSEATAAGLPVVECAGGTRLRQVIEAADIVQVHFWNTPELYELLRGELPPLRLAVWVHVAGDSPPHVVTPWLVELADAIVVSSRHTAALPVFGEPPRVIAGVADTARLARVKPTRHRGFNVGYVGTVDFAKMHPQYVELCARVDVPDLRFVVCGSGDGFGAVDEQARRLGVRDRFDLRGYVEDVGVVLAELDVFGYPLASGNYSTSDLVLQEAMSMGVPPVVLPYGGAQALVDDGVTGLVARDELEYPRLLERLYADPEERARLGENARAAARNWGPAQAAAEWSVVYDGLLQQPKRPRGPSQPFAGAAAFVESLGGTAPEFAASLAAGDEEAERRIAAAPPVLVSAGGGGVLHYRRRYPDDGYLRLWAGLVLAASGRHALAAAELRRANELGCASPRVLQHLAESAERLGAHGVAQRALAEAERR